MAQDLFFLPLGAKPYGGGFDRALVTGILSKGSTEPITTFSCQYPDGSCGECDGIDDDRTQKRISHLGFVHFGGRMMMERIFELADVLDVFLAWSDPEVDAPNACVTREERLARVHAAAKKVLTFTVARNASHLNKLVKGNTFEENGW